MFYAHTLEGRPEVEWEPLRDHLERSAARAEEFASAFEAGPWGRLAGLWHDLGKYSKAFQEYLRATSGGEEGVHQSEVIGQVDHSTAGARLAALRGPFGRLLAYGIAGHHAGLPDNEGEASSLRGRLEKAIEPIDGTPADLLGLALPAPFRLHCEGNSRRKAFAMAFATRVLFSCPPRATDRAGRRLLPGGRPGPPR